MRPAPGCQGPCCWLTSLADLCPSPSTPTTVQAAAADLPAAEQQLHARSLSDPGLLHGGSWAGGPWDALKRLALLPWWLATEAAAHTAQVGRGGPALS